MTALVILLFFLALAIFGIPIAYSLGIAALLFAYLADVQTSIVSQVTFTGLNNFSYIAVPLFILVGNLMETGGLSKRLVAFSSSILLKLPGSLGSIMVLSCAFFGAISGSASATTAAIGGMMIPEMNKKGYSSGYSGALGAISGTLGAIIPPSVVMIIYAVVAEVSVSDMFIAGFLPGIFVALALIATNTIYALVTGVDVAHPDIKMSFTSVRSTFWDAKWALFSPVIILGGIYSGVFTATEAAVVAVVYSFIVGFFIHKELTLSSIKTILLKTCKTVGAVIIIVPFATALARLLTISQTPLLIGSWVLTITHDPNMILLFVVLLVFITGMFLDATPIILIYTPLFLPILKNMGVSPIHFGIVITLGAMVGAVTPPVGVNLFIGQGIAKSDSLSTMKYACMFIAVFMAVYVWISMSPWVSHSLLTFLK